MERTENPYTTHLPLPANLAATGGSTDAYYDVKKNNLHVALPEKTVEKDPFDMNVSHNLTEKEKALQED